MFRKGVFFLIAIILVSACTDDESGTDGELPTNEFSNDYTLSDFNLSDEYEYWEIRRGNMTHQEDFEDDVLQQYDEEAYSKLSELDLQVLEAADTNNGFDHGCVPGFCPYYGVAIIDNTAVVIESRFGLTEFFGSIDTEAELSILLSIGHRKAEAYEKVDGGYLVLVAWDNTCGTRGKDLVKVHSDGMIEKMREISRESYSGCA